MTCHSDVHDYLIGIDYLDEQEDRGHFTIRRRVPLQELVDELVTYITIGHHFPQFPPEALPSVAYAWDYSDHEDGDCYGEVVNALNKQLRSKNGSNH